MEDGRNGKAVWLIAAFLAGLALLLLFAWRGSASKTDLGALDGFL